MKALKVSENKEPRVGKHSKNLTIYERTNPGRIPMELFECFMNNDMDAATEYGRNIDFLKKNNAEFM